MTRSAGGTITRTVFDVRNNAVETYVGTNDAGATDENPDGFNAPGNNMVKTATSLFDNANPVGGNNLLTTALQHVNDNPDNDRRTDFGYDFRNRHSVDQRLYLDHRNARFRGHGHDLRQSRWCHRRCPVQYHRRHGQPDS